MALLARQLYFEAVKVGDELPPLVKPPVDRIQIARYAGATGDYNPLSVDEQFSRNAGFPSALAPGMLAMGFLGELVVDWLRGARLRRFSARFVKIVWPGDVITSRGRVVDRRFEDGGKYGIDIEVWSENQRGELVVRGTVTAQLYYNAEDEARQRAGQPPLVVTVAEEEARLARLSRGVTPRRPEPMRAAALRPAPAPPAHLATARPTVLQPAAPRPAPVKPAPPKPAALKPERKKPGAKKRPRAKHRSAPGPKRSVKPARAARARSASPRKPKGRKRR